MFYVDVIGEHIPVDSFELGVDYIRRAFVNGEDVDGWTVCYLPDFDQE